MFQNPKHCNAFFVVAKKVKHLIRLFSHAFAACVWREKASAGTEQGIAQIGKIKRGSRTTTGEGEFVCGDTTLLSGNKITDKLVVTFCQRFANSIWLFTAKGFLGKKATERTELCSCFIDHGSAFGVERCLVWQVKAAQESYDQTKTLLNSPAERMATVHRFFKLQDPFVKIE